MVLRFVSPDDGLRKGAFRATIASMCLFRATREADAYPMGIGLSKRYRFAMNTRISGELFRSANGRRRRRPAPAREVDGRKPVFWDTSRGGLNRILDRFNVLGKVDGLRVFKYHTKTKSTYCQAATCNGQIEKASPSATFPLAFLSSTSRTIMPGRGS